MGISMGINVRGGTLQEEKCGYDTFLFNTFIYGGQPLALDTTRVI